MEEDRESYSDSATDSDQEGLDTVISELKQQMNTIEHVTNEVTTHVTELFQRTKRETTDWMHEPLRPMQHVREWCRLHEVSLTPTLDDFIEACFTAAIFIDLESRIVTFKKEDAEILWEGRRRVSVFDILSSIPTLFY